MSSISAVKDAIGGGETFSGTLDVTVFHGGNTYLYRNVFVSVSYNIGYMQMDITILWEDDRTNPAYSSLGLHMGYNTNFQDFRFENGYLSWNDGNNRISLRFHN